jgi:hypothetical protein
MDLLRETAIAMLIFWLLKLSCMNANDVSLSCTLQVFVAKRDRQALISYTATLHPQSEGYLYAEYALRVSVRLYFSAYVVQFNCMYVH